VYAQAGESKAYTFFEAAAGQVQGILCAETLNFAIYPIICV
jgi:hypothetical protein